MLRSVSKLGPVTEMGSSSSWEKTAREQVASKPMPRTEAGLILCWLMARCTEIQMQRQISVVDCSCRYLLAFIIHRRKSGVYIYW